MPLLVCKRCKGTGQIWDTAAVNPLIVVFTLGFSLIDAKERCPKCDGDGYIRAI